MSGHIPVMYLEVIHALNPIDNEIYVDATFGAGGYTKAILEAAPGCTVIAIDRDPDAIKRGEVLQKKYGEQLKLVQAPFSDIKYILQQLHIDKVNGIVMDLGVSSYQFDEGWRGFSFQSEGPLDMRMDYQSNSLTAKQIINNFKADELANIIFDYGEERHSRRIAKAIVEARKQKPFETTLELANFIKKVIPSSKKSIHPATLTFQALRIFVNNELIELNKLLNSCHECLDDKGRLVGVTFHSLEDRLLKQYLKAHSKVTKRIGKYGNLSLIETQDQMAHYEILTKKPLVPTAQEMRLNSRSRSAKLRAAIFHSAHTSHSQEVPA